MDKRVKIIEALEGFKVERRIHKGWREWEESKKRIPQMFGKYQYIYSSPKGVISLVLLLNYYKDGTDIWEIYAYDNLFQDIERFKTRKLAEARIRSLLE